MSEKKLARDLRQFRFAGGEEIVCEVVDWGVETDYEEIIIRNVMQISTSEKSPTEQYYIFKPWVHYQEGPDDLLTIYSQHITMQAKPKETLVYCYDGAVAEMHLADEHRERIFAEDMNDKMGAIADKLMKLLEEAPGSDSDKKPTNIVNLSDFNKIH